MERNNKSDLLFNHLRQRIATMENGTIFPSVRQLMTEYNVSQSTVSTAIRSLKELGLLEALSRQGMVVRKERTGKPHVIILQPDWNSQSLTAHAQYLTEAAEKFGFDPEVFRYDYRKDICNSLDKFVSDILVLDSMTQDQFSPKQLLQIMNSPVPVIIRSDSLSIQNIHYVNCENGESGMLAANCLYQHGHRRMAHLLSEPHLAGVMRRASNFQLCAESNHCSMTLLDCNVKTGENALAPIRRFAKEIADGRYDFTGVFVASDESAIQFLYALQEYGIRVPDDLSIIGFGGLPEAEQNGLSSIVTPMRETAQAVMQIARNILDHAPESDCQVNIPPKIIERDSVKTIQPQKETTK